MNKKQQERIVLLGDDGKVIGSADKLASHNSRTPLHLAFSCYIYNLKGEFLLTQRAYAKKVWPGVWTNSVCGHPGPEEPVEDAIKRRSLYELGINIRDLRVVLADYRYKTPPFNGIIENEVCPVYLARTEDKLNLNPEEVESSQWLEWDKFIIEANKSKKDAFSWWVKDQLKLLKDHPLIRLYTQKVH